MGRGRPAPPLQPGTSRSTSPAAIDWAVCYVLADPRLFLNTTSDGPAPPLLVEPASGPLERPADGRALADAETFGIEPIFDGDSSERSDRFAAAGPHRRSPA